MITVATCFAPQSLSLAGAFALSAEDRMDLRRLRTTKRGFKGGERGDDGRARAIVV